VPPVGKRIAAGVPQHVGMALSSIPAPAAARSIIPAKPAVVNGEPRSLTNTRVTTGSRYRRLLRLGSVVAEPVVVLGGLLRSASNGLALWMSRASRLTSIQDNSSTCQCIGSCR
jgi:hypothetical protein